MTTKTGTDIAPRTHSTIRRVNALDIREGDWLILGNLGGPVLADAVLNNDGRVVVQVQSDQGLATITASAKCWYRVNQAL
jgi:hypothetical protein